MFRLDALYVFQHRQEVHRLVLTQPHNHRSIRWGDAVEGKEVTATEESLHLGPQRRWDSRPFTDTSGQPWPAGRFRPSYRSRYRPRVVEYVPQHPASCRGNGENIGHAAGGRLPLRIRLPERLAVEGYAIRSGGSSREHLGTDSQESAGSPLITEARIQISYTTLKRRPRSCRKPFKRHSPVSWLSIT